MGSIPSKGARIALIAEPNGAGRTTPAPKLSRKALGVSEFVNADAIAQRSSAFELEKVALGGEKILLARLKTHAASGESFAFETTLASRSFAPWIHRLKSAERRFGLLQRESRSFMLPTALHGEVMPFLSVRSR